MNKIYLVTSGNYSDFHVDGVFSTRELAQQLHGRLSDATIEEWTLDKTKDYIKRDAWASTIYVADRRLDRAYTSKSQYGELAPPEAILRFIDHTLAVNGGKRPRTGFT